MTYQPHQSEDLALKVGDVGRDPQAVRVIVVGGCSGHQGGKSRHIAAMVASLQAQHDYVVVEYDLEPESPKQDYRQNLHPPQRAFFDDRAALALSKFRIFEGSVGGAASAKFMEALKRIEPPQPTIAKAAAPTPNRHWYRHRSRW